MDNPHFDRYTDRARRVVSIAEEEAQLFQHGYLGTEHLLLGLILAEGKAGIALATAGVTVEAARQKVIEMIGKGSVSQSYHPFTPRANKVLDLAAREALQLGHNYIGTEHILLGLIREGQGVGIQILEKSDISLSELRTSVLDPLQPQPQSIHVTQDVWRYEVAVEPRVNFGCVRCGWEDTDSEDSLEERESKAKNHDCIGHLAMRIRMLEGIDG